MSNEFSGGVAAPPSSAPETLPDNPPISLPTTTDEVINTNRYVALEQLSRNEDISDYAQERADQVEVIDQGREIPKDRQNKWFRRASKALADASAEAAGAFQPLIGEPPPSESYQGSEYETDPMEFARKQGAAAERIKLYFGDNAEKKQSIQDWGSAMDPENHVATWVIENESAVAPQIMERLAAHPEGWLQLAQLPPKTRNRWLSKLEGHIEAELRFGQQQAQQQAQLAQQAARRTTHAPPPIRAPRGGAMPPSDIHALASRSDDVTSYINQRRQQEQRER
jgi:hypothetical protein